MRLDDPLAPVRCVNKKRLSGTALHESEETLGTEHPSFPRDHSCKNSSPITRTAPQFSFVLERHRSAMHHRRGTKSAPRGIPVMGPFLPTVSLGRKDNA